MGRGADEEEREGRGRGKVGEIRGWRKVGCALLNICVVYDMIEGEFIYLRLASIEMLISDNFSLLHSAERRGGGGGNKT